MKKLVLLSTIAAIAITGFAFTDINRKAATAEETSAVTSTVAATTESETTSEQLTTTTEATTEPTTEATTRQKVTRSAETTTAELPEPASQLASASKKLRKCPVSDFEARLFEVTNEERSSRGIQELEWSEDLHNIACIRAKEAYENWSHTRPNGKIWYSILKEYQIYYTNFASENLACNSGEDASPETADELLMNSKPHRKAILDKRYKYVGIATYYGDDGLVYSCQIFCN
ncbi:MAG: CAP domain-containing protein [Eubacterium sp.]|nr:CAP domain-containing protein [Eubacterium sp.]